MFGIGPSELVIIGVLFLVIFGPSKLPQMARDAGRMMTEARRAMDDFKEELTSAPDNDKKEAEKKSAKKGSGQRAKSGAESSEEAGPTENGRVAEDKSKDEEEYDL